MENAYELLMEAPDGQVKRCQIVCREIAKGQWDEAAFALHNAANEEQGAWAEAAKELAEYCAKQK